MSSGDMQSSLLKLSDEEIALRKKWLELDQSDEDFIKEKLDPLIANRSDELIEAMYSHFLSFEETRSFFPDENTLKRAQEAQKEYFERLTKGSYNLEYVDNRLAVGSMHYRIELDPKWYLGAYNRVISWFLPQLTKTFCNDPAQLNRALSALMKLIFFDMGLAIDCYIAAKESAIRKHRNAIQELETERRVTKSILESAPIGIVSLSKDLVCLECNDEFVEMLDIADRKMVLGQQLFDITKGLDLRLFKNVLATGQAHRRTADLLRLSRSESKDDTYWDWAVWPVKEDSSHSTGLVAMFANATDRVLLQQQREDFVATLTHDLKTPVSATNRAIRFLLDGDFGAVSDSQRELLETVLQSNTALYGLVQTLLDVYRFDSGVKKLHIRSCNLAAIITQAVTEIMPLAYEKNVELKATLPASAESVRCDEDEIKRVIQNLVDNALKFTAAGGFISISMVQEESKTRVSVSDTGRGIPEENKPKLFQRFWQAGSTGRYYASTGLGLYLCRRIVEGHAGKIWCESILGRGSVFYFEIPTSDVLKS